MGIENIKKAFEGWLTKGPGRDEEKRHAIFNVAEQMIPWFIRDNIDPDFNTLYEITEPDKIKDLWHKINSDNRFKQINKSLIPVNYTEVLRFYEQFLHAEKSKSHVFQELDINNTSDGKKPISKSSNQELMTEGALQELHVTKHERNPQLRRKCIEIYGWKCIACGFDFQERYGDLGKEYIEVHHLFPISQTDGKHDVDPGKDLVPLCANCHAMIHRLKGEEMSLENLKKVII